MASISRIKFVSFDYLLHVYVNAWVLMINVTTKSFKLREASYTCVLYIYLIKLCVGEELDTDWDGFLEFCVLN